MDFDPHGLADVPNEAWATEIKTIGAGGVDALVAIVRNGEAKQIVDLKSLIDNWREKPKRVIGTARVQSPDSFAELVNRHKNEASALFCDTSSNPSLTAVIDYHGEGAAAEWAKHRVHYAFPLSDEWNFWNGVMVKGRLTQEEFAFLIEDRIADLVKAEDTGPEAEIAEMMGVTIASPAEMLTLSKGLKIRVEQIVKEQRNVGTGADQIAFEENHNGENGHPLKVPGMFMISIPIFTADTFARIPVRLRYRVVDRKTVWFPQIYRPDLVLREKVEAVAEMAAAQTLLPLFYGAPESA